MKYVEKLIRIVFTTFYKIFDMHPTSDPFISGDTFRNLADYVFNPLEKNISSSISNLKDGSVIFVNTNDYYNFIKIRNALGNKHFKIICHNSDNTFDHNMLELLPSHDTVFAVNAFKHFKNLIPIPIGLENKRLHQNGITSRYNKYDSNNPSIPKVFYSFSIQTNPTERTFYFNKLSEYDFSVGYERLDNENYLLEMSKFMFCFSPPGNGVDCHRTWEAIALNVVPICLKSPVIDYFVGIGLPIWAINDFKDIEKYKTSSDLNEKYLSIMKKSNKNPLYLKYWQNRLNF